MNVKERRLDKDLDAFTLLYNSRDVRSAYYKQIPTPQQKNPSTLETPLFRFLKLFFINS